MGFNERAIYRVDDYVKKHIKSGCRPSTNYQDTIPNPSIVIWERTVFLLLASLLTKKSLPNKSFSHRYGSTVDVIPQSGIEESRRGSRYLALSCSCTLTSF